MTDYTAWPAENCVPATVQQLITRFFVLADTNEKSSPDEISALFTNDGEMHGLGGVFRGRPAIREGRAKSWNGIASRHHRVLTVYSRGKEASDILLIGEIYATLVNGRTLNTEFTARLIVDNASGNDPRISFYKSWADSAPWIKALTG
ncbi:hypothetical protein BKA66DRAFT_613678 [Pyrenochaeta sp. MPI-SDFR-AT-0127]|nr:hypothetical protein BKA66DRAFT_613678 [Pyrenochaeta sp. MPI-SDFR-AT-0127]